MESFFRTWTSWHRPSQTIFLQAPRRQNGLQGEAILRTSNTWNTTTLCRNPVSSALVKVYLNFAREEQLIVALFPKQALMSPEGNKPIPHIKTGAAVPPPYAKTQYTMHSFRVGGFVSRLPTCILVRTKCTGVGQRYVGTTSHHHAEERRRERSRTNAHGPERVARMKGTRKAIHRCPTKYPLRSRGLQRKVSVWTPAAKRGGELREAPDGLGDEKNYQNKAKTTDKCVCNITRNDWRPHSNPIIILWKNTSVL